jgi:hypothetical protein
MEFFLMNRFFVVAALFSGFLALAAGCGDTNPPGKLPDKEIPIIKDGPAGGPPKPKKDKDAKQPSAAVD